MTSLSGWRKPQRVHGDLEGPVEVPGPRGVDLVLQVGLLRQERVEIGVRSTHSVADLVEPIDQALDGGHSRRDVAEDVLRRVELRLLRQEADRESRRDPGFAAVAIVLARHDAEERRLAGAIGPDDADLGTWIKRQVDPLEDLAVGRVEASQVTHRVDELRWHADQCVSPVDQDVRCRSGAPCHRRSHLGARRLGRQLACQHAESPGADPRENRARCLPLRISSQGPGVGLDFHEFGPLSPVSSYRSCSRYHREMWSIESAVLALSRLQRPEASPARRCGGRISLPQLALRAHPTALIEGAACSCPRNFPCCSWEIRRTNCVCLRIGKCGAGRQHRARWSSKVRARCSVEHLPVDQLAPYALVAGAECEHPRRRNDAQSICTPCASFIAPEIAGSYGPAPMANHLAGRQHRERRRRVAVPGNVALGILVVRRDVMRWPAPGPGSSRCMPGVSGMRSRWLRLS